MDYAKARSLVEAHRQELLAFAQRLVQAPSLPGEEAAVAALVQEEMRSLGYDKVWLDEAGNVVGYIEGGNGPSLMFNGHMDHVDAGDPGRWIHPPFGGEVHSGELWGRAAVDMKGALAAMVHAGGLARRLGIILPGDLYVSGVVQEEVGGLGSRQLSQMGWVSQQMEREIRQGWWRRLDIRFELEARIRSDLLCQVDGNGRRCCQPWRLDPGGQVIARHIQ